MTETYDPVSHIAVIALIVFYWHLLRIWHQPPPSDRDRDTATRKPAAPQQLAAETDSQKGRSLRANARGTAISPAAQAERAPATSPCNAPFDESSFLAGAAVAYERVLEAYIDEDEDVLQQLLDPALLAVFVEAISARKKRGERRELIFIGIRDMRTLQTRADPTMTTVTVRFVSEAVLVTYGMDGAVVDGHPQKVVQMTDDWSFARPRSSTDPNWQLVATGGIGHAPKKRPDISRQHFIQSRPDYESSPATRSFSWLGAFGWEASASTGRESDGSAFWGTSAASRNGCRSIGSEPLGFVLMVAGRLAIPNRQPDHDNAGGLVAHGGWLGRPHEG